MKYYTYWPIRSVLHFFDTKVSKKCNTNLIGQCEAPRTWLLQKRCRDAAVHFQNWVEQKVELSFSDSHTKSCPLKQCFTVSRTAELSSEGVSKLVLTLAVAKIAVTSMFAKLQKLGTDWHALCYCVRFLLACLASYSGFPAIAFAPWGTRRLVCATDGKCWGEKAWLRG